MPMASLSERVRERRSALKFSQSKLSEESGISQASISRIERGDVAEVRAKHERALAFALKTTVAYLTGVSDDPDAPEGSAPAPPPSPTLDRDPAARVPEEHETPLETAVVELFRAPELRHLRVPDLQAAVEAVRQSYRHMAPDADLMATARAYLVAAYQLRTEGREADPMAVVSRAAGSKSQVIQARLDAVDAQDLADADEAFAASGLPDNSAEVQRVIAERMKKRRGG